MKTSIDRDYRIAYVLDKDGLERIFAFLKEFGPVDQIVASCVDGSSITFDDLEELINFPNPNTRAIKSLTLYLNHIEPRKESMTLWLHFTGGGIRSTVASDDLTAVHVSDRAGELISTFRRWYTRIALADVVDLIFGAFLILTFAAGIALAIWVALGERVDLSSGTDVSGPAIGYLSGGLIVLLGLAANILKSRMFPIAEFATGGGVRRHERAAFLRKLLGLYIAIPLLVGIVGGIIVSFLT